MERIQVEKGEDKKVISKLGSKKHSTNIRKDMKATSEHGQFFIINMVGNKFVLKGVGIKVIRVWNKLGVPHQNTRNLSGKRTELEALLEAVYRMLMFYVLLNTG